MPIFDLTAIARALVKYGFIIGIIAYIAGLSNMLGDAVLSLWDIVSHSIDALNGVMTSSTSTGGSKVLSCMYYFISELGIDIVLTSFSVSAIGLLVSWASIIVHLLLIRIVFVAKNYLLEGAK